MICPIQLTCEDYSCGYKRRDNYTRQYVECIRIDDGTCPMLGSACDLAKIKRIKEQLKERAKDD